MRCWFAALSLIVVIAAGQPVAAQTPVTDCSRVEADGQRTLCHETLVQAPLAEVWSLWATGEGLRTWMAPVAAIELRAGAVMETSYDPNGRIGDPANIRNRIMEVEPQRLLVIQVAQAPPNFPHANEVMQLVTRIEFEAAGDSATRVRVVMQGYGDGEAYDALYRHFAWGNDWTLKQLITRAVNGPTDWRAQAAAE